MPIALNPPDIDGIATAGETPVTVAHYRPSNWRWSRSCRGVGVTRENLSCAPEPRQSRRVAAITSPTLAVLPIYLSSARMTRTPVPSSAYKLFEQAMTSRKQILCAYDGYPRELCPVILGHTNGQEVALVYQFAGQSKSSLPPRGQWKCLSLSKISNIQLRDGPWHAGASHTKPQPCVQAVDLDVNPASPYNPKRRLPIR
jgi:hypothetical protein